RRSDLTGRFRVSAERRHGAVDRQSDTNGRAEATETDGKTTTNVPYGIRVGNTSEHVDPPPPVRNIRSWRSVWYQSRPVPTLCIFPSSGPAARAWNSSPNAVREVS